MRRTRSWFVVCLLAASLAYADAPRVGVVTGTVFDPDGVPTVAFVYENIPDARQERTSLSLVARRRFRNNWTMTASYTWSETEGNCYNVWNSWCAQGFGKLRAVTNDDGVPMSVVNRDGVQICGRSRHSVRSPG